VLLPSEAPGQPLAARGLRDLLAEAADGVKQSGRDARSLIDNLERLRGLAARLLDRGGPEEDLRGLVSRAGFHLVQALELPESDQEVLATDLAALVGRLPEDGELLELGPETPLRAYLAALEAERGPRQRRFRDELEQLAERLRDLLELDRLRADASHEPGALEETFGSGSAGQLDMSALSRTLPRSTGSEALDPGRRARILDSLDRIERRLEEEVPGGGAIFVHPPELPPSAAGLERLEHPDPLSAAVGVFDGVAARMAPLFRAVRAARLEVEGRYRPGLHDPLLAGLTWEAYTADELLLLPAVVALDSARRVRERDEGALSRLLSSSRPVHVIVLDEVGARDEAEDLSRYHLDLGYLLIAHREALVVSSALARPAEFASGLARVARALRPAAVLVQLPAREPRAWRELLAEAALQGRACPEFVYDPDAGPGWEARFDLSANPCPELAWPAHRMTCLADGSEETLDVPVTFADAVALEPAYRRHLRVIPRAAWDESQVPLAEFVQRVDPQQSERSIPFIWMEDGEGVLQRAIVTRELAIAVLGRLRGWRVLQELAGYESSFVARAAAAAREHTLAEAEAERAELERTHGEELERIRSETARESFERLAEALLSAEGEPLERLTPVARPAAPLAPEPASLPGESAATQPPSAVEPEPEEALTFDEPWLDTPLCTTCNECTNLNPLLFQYNEDKQAFLADAAAGTFAELVKAAELCPARCIHPGRPRADDRTATPELVERGSAFN
jgi:ferredoxin